MSLDRAALADAAFPDHPNRAALLDAALAAIVPAVTAELDLACSVLDLARHAISDPGKRIERTKGVLYGEDSWHLVRDWEDRKRRARDITPAHVRHHQNEAERAIDAEARGQR